MEACTRCGHAEMTSLAVEDSMEVAGHSFSATVPARRCGSCGDILIDARDLKDFERAVVLALAASGQRSGLVLRALRKGIGLTESRAADLLDVHPEAVRAWEEGRSPVPPHAAALLRSIVVSKLSGASQPIDRLSLLRHPGQLARKVRLQLERSLDGFSPKVALA